MSLLIDNISTLLQVREVDFEVPVRGRAMQHLPTINDAWLYIEGDRIVDYGLMNGKRRPEARQYINAKGGVVLPCWCDSHTHLVYAGSRITEFIDRLEGLSYQEIANRGGGILNSAKKLRLASEDELYKQSALRLKELMTMGTGAIEIKSGYGLDTAAELKMLRVIRRLKNDFKLPVKATFLAAHALPEEFKNRKKEYLDLIIDEMLPLVIKDNLADFIDIFCEKDYFSVEDTEQLLQAATRDGLKAKIHVNQFNAIGGIAVAVKNKALSVDHLEVLTAEDLAVLKTSETIVTALPGCSFFLGIPFTPVRKLMEANIPVALATDFNPGSAPSGNMNFVVSAACIQMKMTPEEAINAATINGAYAMGLSDAFGSITRGKKANIIITRPMDSFARLAYNFSHNPIEKVIINGKVLSD